MKLGDIIDRLLEIQEQHGTDVEVVKFSFGFCDPIDSIEFTEIYIPKDEEEYSIFKAEDQDQTLDYKLRVVL
jgi:hypothetical protein